MIIPYSPKIYIYAMLGWEVRLRNNHINCPNRKAPCTPQPHALNMPNYGYITTAGNTSLCIAKGLHTKKQKGKGRDQGTKHKVKYIGAEDRQDNLYAKMDQQDCT